MTTLRWGGATDIGRARDENEDSLFADRTIFVVADGMGGPAAGGEASKLAVAAFERLAQEPTVDAAAVQTAMTRANESILDAAARDNGAWRGMGTTIVGLALIEDGGETHWLVFNIGDSRAYRMADGVLERLTVDHAIGSDLTRVLGGARAPAPDYLVRRPQPGERFLLCSDGLTRELCDDQLRLALTVPDEPETVARDLVSAAVNAGGRDNVSALVVEVLA